MTTAPVLAATRWVSNADLIVDCARLGYLHTDWLTLDPTFGRGVWWSKWRPEQLVCHDLTIDGQDFRSLPYSGAKFDAVAYDPPYVCVGGRHTTTIADMHDRYGLTAAPATPAKLQDLIDDGLTEMHRLVKPDGFVLVKCQDYVSSGKLWIGTHHTLCHALALGFDVQDRLEHVTHPRPQPGGRQQKHARRNLSTLLVLRKAKR